MYRAVSYLVPYFLPLALAAASLAALSDISQQTGIATGGAVGITCILMAIDVMRRGRLRLSPAAFAGIPLLLIAGVPQLRGGISLHSIFGNGFEMGTVGAFFIFAVAVAFSVSFERPNILLFLRVVVSTAVSLSLGAILLRLGVGHLELFASTWPQTPLLLSAAALIAALLYDSESHGMWKYLYAAATGLLLVGLAVFPDVAASGLGACGAAFIFVFMIISIRPTSMTRFPVASAAVMLVCAGLFIFGGTSTPVVDTATVYPSLTAAQLIIEPAYRSGPIAYIGTGGSFSNAWATYQPQQINQTPLWNYDPSSLYSTAATFAMTIGLIGLFAFFLAPLSLLVIPFVPEPKRLRGHPDHAARTQLASCIVLTLFLFVSALWYPMSVPVFIVAGIAFGFASGILSRHGRVTSIYSVPVRFVIATLLVLMGGGITYMSARTFVAARYHRQALSTLQTDRQDPARSLSLFDKAVYWWPAPQYLIDDSNVESGYALALFPKGSVPSGDPNTAKFTALIYQAVAHSSNATVADRSDHEVWLARASLFIKLVPFQFPQATTTASNAIKTAAQLSPNDPRPLYLQALLDQAIGDSTSALTDLKKALILKPDYADALKLQEEILSR